MNTDIRPGVTSSLPRWPVAGAGRVVALLLVALVLLGAPAPRALAIQGGSEVASTERSLEAVAQFTRVQWQDLPGALGNAVLIAPDRVLIPRHLINFQFNFPGTVDQPAEQFIVRFRRRPDGTLANPEDPASYFTVGIRGFSFLKDRDAGADAVVAILTTTVRHIEPITVDFERRIAPGSRVQIVSWGQQQAGIQTPADSRAQPARLRQGEIILSAWDRRQLSIQTSTTARNLATVVDSDSGAGLFIQVNGRPRLIGIATRQAGGVSLAQLKRESSFFPGKAAFSLSALATPFNRNNPPPPPASPPQVVTPPRGSAPPQTPKPRPRGVFRLSVQ